MDKLKEDINLLEECIEHWQGVKKGFEQPMGSKCALCNEYSNEENGYDCKGCPIYGKTGEEFCVDTPYNTFVNVMGCNNYRIPRELSFLAREKAQDMINFLVNLKEELEERCKKNSE